MSERAPYTLFEPAVLSSNAVFNSPHSGRVYPEAFLHQTRLNARELRASEDAFVDDLYAPAPDHGAPLMTATFPRAWVDLNRGPGELDPALIHGARAAGINQRIAAGLGVIPRIVAEGTLIYDGKITLAEAERRLATVHMPYHARLETLLCRARDAFGAAVLFDCHSMPTEALRAAPRVGGQIPEIVLGDRFGAAAAREVTAATQAAFEAVGFRVARNAPFAGGYITQRYGRPMRGMHAVQIEIDRGLYLDQARIEPHGGFEETARRLARVIAELTQVVPGAGALAAE